MYVLDPRSVYSCVSEARGYQCPSQSRGSSTRCTWSMKQFVVSSHPAHMGSQKSTLLVKLARDLALWINLSCISLFIWCHRRGEQSRQRKEKKKESHEDWDAYEKTQSSMKDEKFELGLKTLQKCLISCYPEERIQGTQMRLTGHCEPGYQAGTNKFRSHNEESRDTVLTCFEWGWVSLWLELTQASLLVRKDIPGSVKKHVLA